ncbi:MAG: 50S ribosomal protein L5 [Candidatus Omnitrophica bacterium CG23_combo_of_CG06-09_8_20_14_all_40_11]|nr:MAG: 50S ribosomal protein L5 [Candidatus Omnitrophica bacterium CG23_combo_of_CG06-09_8_20_14_all_40_11]
MTPRLLEKYRNEIIPKMMEAFSFKNRMAVPRLEKIVVNMGVGEALQDMKILEKAMEELATITGQKPILRRAKKAIANFKIKQGQPIGCKVTLRRTIMYEFLDRLISIALPRIRDFRGISPDSFDESGNYTMGITEQSIFPEIDYDRVSRMQGMDITLVIKNAKSKEQSRELLKLFGMPFRTAND